MSANPFDGQTTTVRWRCRVNRWRDGILRPWRPSRLTVRRDGPPHLVLIGVDTLRADHLGLMGYGQPTSPQLDRLAAAGTVFADVTAPAPWTLPSFASALTARMPSLHGACLPGAIRNMDTQAPSRLAADVPTLASHLRARGYRTAAFYSNPFFGFGLAESFDDHVYLNLPAAEVARQAQEWLRRRADRPCFCFLLFNDPHEPTTPDAVDLAPFLPRLAGLGVATDNATVADYARWGRVPGVDLTRAAWPVDPATDRACLLKLAIYDATIHYVDRVIGELQSRLDAWGLRDQTLVSVFSDHGEEFLDHAAWAHRWDHDPRGIHGIGHGHSHFQEVLHVPWLSWGAGVPAGQRRRQPASLLDLAPTLLAWLGLPALPAPPAGPFVEQLTGRTLDRNHPAERLVLSEAIAYGPDLVALRRGDRKLVAHRDGRVLALFDLAADPGESRDVSGDQPETVKAMLAELAAWRQGSSRTTPDRGDDWNGMDDTIRQRLRDLGYSE